MWSPTTLEVLQAMTVALADSVPQRCNALFIHGAPIRDNELDKLVAKKAAALQLSGQVGTVIINGLNAETCRNKNLAYGGFESMFAYLLNENVVTENILVMTPSPHTGAESRNLLTLATENAWTRLAIMSHPHHQLRCFLQIIALMSEVGYWPNVYNIPGPGIDWNRPIEKPVMAGETVTGGKNISGTLPTHIEEELTRIVTYAQQPEIVNGNPKFTRNATLPEMFEYLSQRN
ncbi:hypothetical protein ACFL16_01770 [Patescibacteria group bacterium]